MDLLKEMNPLRASFIEMGLLFSVVYLEDHDLDDIGKKIQTLNVEIQKSAQRSSFGVMSQITELIVFYEAQVALDLFNEEINALKRQALEFLEIADYLFYQEDDGLIEWLSNDHYFKVNYKTLLDVWGSYDVWGGFEHKYKMRNDAFKEIFSNSENYEDEGIVVHDPITFSDVAIEGKRVVAKWLGKVGL